MKKTINNRGFTLIEMLLVVAIISILAGIVILAINPAKQLADTRNAQRRSDVTTILNAVYQYSIDHSGTLPGNITTSTSSICQTGVSTTTCTGVDLSALTNNQQYIVSIPVDPSSTSTTVTGYDILKTANNRVTVDAPNAEEGAVISVTR